MVIRGTRVKIPANGTAVMDALSLLDPDQTARITFITGGQNGYYILEFERSELSDPEVFPLDVWKQFTFLDGQPVA